jgi:hypothetical protein
LDWRNAWSSYETRNSLVFPGKNLWGHKGRQCQPRLFATTENPWLQSGKLVTSASFFWGEQDFLLAKAVAALHNEPAFQASSPKTFSRLSGRLFLDNFRGSSRCCLGEISSQMESSGDSANQNWRVPMGGLWALLTILGPILLGLVLLYAVLRNRARASRREIDRTERATRRMHRQIAREEKEDGG